MKDIFKILIEFLKKQDLSLPFYLFFFNIDAPETKKRVYFTHDANLKDS